MKTFDNMWEQIHKEQDWGKYPSEEVIRFIARNFYMKDRKNVKLLDFGCGTGVVSWYLAREGFSTYGFDGSPTAVEKAKIRMKEENVSVNLCVCDAGELLYGDNFFDGIVDSAVIYANEMYGIKVILKECYRVINKSGKFLSTGLFNSYTTGYGTGNKIEENTYREITEGNLAHRGTVHFFEKDEIISLWQEAGFKNIKIDEIKRTDMGGDIQ